MPRRKDDRIARLGWDIDGEFHWRPADGPNRAAAELVVATRQTLGHLDDVDDAAVMAFVMLAEAVDNDPTNAGLWAQYRAADVTVRGLGSNDDDALARLLAELSPTVRDTTESESGDTRVGGGESGEGDGATVDAVAATGGRRRRGTAT